MQKIKAGIIGAGFIGVMHIEAVRRLGYVDLVALSEFGDESARAKADQFHIAKAYGNYEDLIADPEIQVIHNCTPTNLHLEVNRKIIQAGKHILSEKPLGMTSQESAELLELLKKHPVCHGINYNYRMYPLAQEMRRKIEAGELGKLWLVHGSYLQDWLLYETDYNWRIEPEISGRTRAVGDIGSHWCDLAQFLTGSKIVEVFSEFATVHPVRKKSRVVETFSVNRELKDYDLKEVKTEDWAAVLVRFENGARGVFHCGEISAGRKCFLNIELSGSQRTFYWNQEQGDQMWVGHRDQPNQSVMRDPNQMTAGARPYAATPGGHPEAWPDSVKNSIGAFYEFVRQGKRPETHKADFATFYDGHDMMCVVDAIARSHDTGVWTKVERGAAVAVAK